MTGYRYYFLLASERSGSNLLTRLVGTHSQVCGPSPSHLFRLFANNSWRYGCLTDDLSWELFVDDLLVTFEAKLGHWDVVANRDEILNLPTRDVAAPIRHLYEMQASFEGAGAIFVKENQAAQFGAFLRAHFPSARYVHLVRDPRDVASSWLRTEAMPGGVAEAVSSWLRDQEADERFLATIEPESWLRIRYEDLLANPRETLLGLYDFAGIRYEPVHETFFESHSIRRDAQRIGAWKNLQKPLLAENTKKFAAGLTPGEQAYVEYRCRDLMAKYHYLGSVGTCDVALAPPPRAVVQGTESAVISPVEATIRARRLSAINRVLQRVPPNSSKGEAS